MVSEVFQAEGGNFFWVQSVDHADGRREAGETITVCSQQRPCQRVEPGNDRSLQWNHAERAVPVVQVSVVYVMVSSSVPSLHQ
jgi:hypothetical protein